jgi:threonine dehydrogenase-like Zn-dependent dehydrogenase
VVEESRSTLAEGTRVFSFHPHQDRFVTDSTAVFALGADAGRSATLFPLVETALQITLDAGPLLGETVVVFGLGVVGALTSLMLQRTGARVLAVEPRPWRREAIAALGVETMAPDQLPATRVPLVVEASGNPEVLAAALPLLAHEGTVLVASWYGTKPVTLPLGQEFHRRRLTIRSTQVSTIPARLADRWDGDRRRHAVVDLLDELPLASLATHTFSFEDAPEAYAALDAGQRGLIHAAMGYE